MGAGKTTIATMIKAELREQNLKVVELTFATAVRKVAEILYEVSPTDRSRRARKVLQDIGNGFRRDDPNVWVKIVDRHIRKIRDRYDYIMVTDVRHLNEATYIISQGGNLIFINATGTTRKDRIEKRDDIIICDHEWEEMHYHPSESEVAQVFMRYGYDKHHPQFKLFNNNTYSTLPELETRIKVDLKRLVV